MVWTARFLASHKLLMCPWAGTTRCKVLYSNTMSYFGVRQAQARKPGCRARGWGPMRYCVQIKRESERGDRRADIHLPPVLGLLFKSELPSVNVI